MQHVPSACVSVHVEYCSVFCAGPQQSPSSQSQPQLLFLSLHLPVPSEARLPWHVLAQLKLPRRDVVEPVLRVTTCVERVGSVKSLRLVDAVTVGGGARVDVVPVVREVTRRPVVEDEDEVPPRGGT